MKKVFLYAYDRQNLGDDLFVYSLVYRYPSVQFYLWSDKTNQKNFRNLSNIRVFNKESFLQVLLGNVKPSLGARRKDHLESRCDAVVYIGGSIFIEYENWETILTWWDYEVSHRNMFILGANFGPYKTDAYKSRMKTVFSKMKDVCFREEYSKNLFEDLPNVRSAPDILFGYPIPKRKKTEKQVFVSLIDCSSEDHYLGEYEEEYYNVIFHLLKEAEQSGYRIVLSSFCRKEGDERAVARFENKFKNLLKTELNHCFYNGANKEEVLQEISDSDVVVGTRFHASVLGFAAEKPVLPIIYSDKMAHVLEDTGYKGKYLDIRALEQISFIDVLSDAARQKMPDLQTLRAKSEVQFAALDYFLQK